MMRFPDGTEVLAKDGPSYSAPKDNDCEGLNERVNGNSNIGRKRKPSALHPDSAHGSKKQHPQNVAVPGIPKNEFARNGQNKYETEEDTIAVSMGCPFLGSGGEVGTARNDAIAANDQLVDRHTNENLQRDGVDIEKESEAEWSNKGWNDFINVVNADDAPNLQAYLATKEIRHQNSTRFANAIDDCILELRKTTNEILSDVVAPICNKLSEVLEDSEDEIIKRMMSNHIRRQKLLEIIHIADSAWKEKYTKLLADIKGVGKTDATFETDGKSLKVSCKGKADIKGKEDVAAFPDRQEQIPQTQNILSKTNSYKEMDSGGQDVDWEELAEYEPARPRILSFLDHREKRNCARGNFAEIMDEVHAGLENEVQTVFYMASTVFRQNIEACLESEEEIENLVMENYERRRNLREELENSARQAQEQFATLLSRLG